MDLKRILEIIKRTGDRHIVSDDQGDSFVIIPFDQYEELTKVESETHDSKKKRMLDEVNLDIAEWKAQQQEEDFELRWEDIQDQLCDDSDETMYYFEPIDDDL